MIDHLFVFIILALFAEVLGTIGGFGSSLFFVPVAAYFLDFHSVLGVTAAFHVCSNLAKIGLFRHGFDKKILLTVGVPAVVFVTLGAILTGYLDQKLLQVILAFFLITISILFMAFKNLKVRPTLLNAMGGGALSGFTAGLLGSGGAVRGLTLAAFDLRKNIFIATSAMIDLGVDLSRSFVYFSNGYLHSHDLYLIIILLVVSVVGTYLGKQVTDRFSESQFKMLVLSMILVIGVFSLLKPFLFSRS